MVANLLVLLLHGLIGVALLGAITHQAIALWRHPDRTGASAAAHGLPARYVRVTPTVFTRAVIVLFVTTAVLGAWLYPTYRLDVRVPLEEMRLSWAIGLFELKEHTGGIGLALLPVYAATWADDRAEAIQARRGLTSLLAGMVWFCYLAGHVLNNIRGLWP